MKDVSFKDMVRRKTICSELMGEIFRIDNKSTYEFLYFKKDDDGMPRGGYLRSFIDKILKYTDYNTMDHNPAKSLP